MTEKNGLVLVYTGTDVNISRIKYELEIKGINSIVKDGFNAGLAAGFGGGIPSAIDLFVTEADLDKAMEIINALVGE
ncbi:MAG: DUF2007 domain-containing protein [Draconibacterium sp.]|nr:DUF2007 domain-containing protein [Draconibacterium sp.]